MLHRNSSHLKAKADAADVGARVAACCLNCNDLTISREPKFANRIERLAGPCDHTTGSIRYNQHLMGRERGSGSAQRIGVATSARQQCCDTFGIGVGVRRS